MRVSVTVSGAKGAPQAALRSEDFKFEIAGKAAPGEVQILDSSSSVEGQPDAGSDKFGRGLVVIVLDTVHTRWREEKDVRACALKYLSSFATRNAPVTLFMLDSSGKLNPVHDYRSGSATLAAALEAADAELHERKRATPTASPETDAETRRLVDFVRGTGVYAATHETDRGYPGYVLAGMETVARYAASVSGRKSLVWVSSMIPFEVEEKQSRVASLARNDGNAQERLLLTDDEVTKLQPLWKESIGALQQSEMALYPVAVRTDAAIQVEMNVLHAMTSLAHVTGGREFHGTGDPFPQLGDLPGVNKAAYDVLVAPEAIRECRSEWCTLKIAVGFPGAHVLAPSGFFRDASLEETGMHSSAPPSGSEPESIPEAIAFTVTWKATEDAGTKRKCPFIITFGPKSLVPAIGSGELKLDITVSAVSEAFAKQTITFSTNSQLPAATIAQIKLKGFALSNAIELQPGDYQLSFMVRDKLSGRSGVLKIPLKVS